MHLACPECSAPSQLSAMPVDRTGRVLECVRCGARWQARLSADASFASIAAGLRAERRRPRFERVIDHVQPDFGAQAFEGKAARHDVPPAGRERNGGWRGVLSWSGALAIAIVSGLVTIGLLNTPGAGASVIGTGAHSGIEIRVLSGAVEAVRRGHAVALEGEIVNRSGGAVDVPAVRVSLRSRGAERYVWTIEPSLTTLDTGGQLRFRSALASPPAGLDEIAFEPVTRSGAASR